MHLLFTVISITLAQPAMLNKGKVDNSTQIDTLSNCQGVRDDLYVELLAVDDPDVPIGYHYPNDSSLLCPDEFYWEWQYFRTNYNPPYYHHTWETSLEPDEYYVIEGWNSPDSAVCYIIARMYKSCYIKVTVNDDYGNTGTDSIYFNIKNWITPPDDFEMEIINVNGQLNAKFSFMPSNDTWFFGTYMSQDNISHNPDYIPDDEGWIYYNGTQLYQGVYIDEFVINYYNYNENTVWNILTETWDTCAQTKYDIFPGMYLFTENIDDNHLLKFKTSLQSGNHDEYVYTIFTVDSNGARHPFIVDGGQIFLPSNAVNYELPAPHEHPYYQCAVASDTDNGDYKILSYSNKVANPWITTTTIDECEDYEFQIYPNPTNGMVTVETVHAPSLQGQMEYRITNAMGQILMTGQIVRRDGECTVSTTIDVSGLPQGVYFISIGSTTRKIVVE